MSARTVRPLLVWATAFHEAAARRVREAACRAESEAVRKPRGLFGGGSGLPIGGRGYAAANLQKLASWSHPPALNRRPADYESRGAGGNETTANHCNFQPPKNHRSPVGSRASKPPRSHRGRSRITAARIAADGTIAAERSHQRRRGGANVENTLPLQVCHRPGRAKGEEGHPELTAGAVSYTVDRRIRL